MTRSDIPPYATVDNNCPWCDGPVKTRPRTELLWCGPCQVWTMPLGYIAGCYCDSDGGVCHTCAVTVGP